jgi:hypothetical protein
MYCVEWMELHRKRDGGEVEMYCLEWMELHREIETVGKLKCTVQSGWSCTGRERLWVR